MGAARKYPDELRDRAVRLVLDLVKDQDASVTAACRKVGGELGIKADTLRGWAKQAQAGRGMRPGTSSAEAARIRALERENAELRRVNAILRTASAFFRGRARPPVALVVAFIEACRDQFGVGPACRALRQAGVAVSPSGYYAARARPPSARAVREAALARQILRVYKDSGERYGAWKVWDQLNREGIAAARCTVERLMRELGLRGVRRGGYKVRTTRPDPSQDRPEDLVNRDFAPDAPDRLWVVDFTFVATWAGTAYTALVIDAFARLITGWRTAASHSTDLVLDALVMAVTYRARQGVKVAGLTHHSDAGSEYLSIRYGAELAAAGIAPSVGSVGDSYDNALAESIIGLYKTEVINHLGPWETPAQVEAATSQWASWYNTARVMRRTGGRPPAGYEQAWRDGTLSQVPARGPGSKPRRPSEGGGHGRRS
ncbi:MAG: IS3 family transposase [Streptosporangiaceae bacterium]